MSFYPLDYHEPLFRPPGEAYSLIFQITLGCSWNKCAFCEMYTSKQFKVRNEQDVLNEIKTMAHLQPETRKIFLADGNPMVLSTKKLLTILNALNKAFPKLTRVSTYALPKDINSKTLEELKQIREAGLKILYVGVESGDDELLRLIHKGETFNSTADALLKAQDAGLKNSVMILNGLGGQKYSEQHAINSALILNKIQPYFVSTLVLSFPYGENKYKEKFKGEFTLLSKNRLIKETEIFIRNLELKNTIFRSDHASNYLVLKGVLSKDKERLLNEINNALNKPETLRKEWMRGL